MPEEVILRFRLIYFIDLADAHKMVLFDDLKNWFYNFN